MKGKRIKDKDFGQASGLQFTRLRFIQMVISV